MQPLLELFIGEQQVRMFLKGPSGSYCGVDQTIDRLSPDDLHAAAQELLTAAEQTSELDLFSADLNDYWLTNVHPLEAIDHRVRLVTVVPVKNETSRWLVTAWRGGQGRTEEHTAEADANSPESLWQSIVAVITASSKGRHH